eukprot:GHVS01049973.1.p1 GENE.GHVS01049973.1~~GHVS01049973.1.p1  ORF type:complete len:409 (+),score=49.36 GHVS01049973.1:77-1228(+)
MASVLIFAFLLHLLTTCVAHSYDCKLRWWQAEEKAEDSSVDFIEVSLKLKLSKDIKNLGTEEVPVEGGCKFVSKLYSSERTVDKKHGATKVYRVEITNGTAETTLDIAQHLHHILLFTKASFSLRDSGFETIASNYKIRFVDLSEPFKYSVAKELLEKFNAEEKKISEGSVTTIVWTLVDRGAFIKSGDRNKGTEIVKALTDSQNTFRLKLKTTSQIKVESCTIYINGQRKKLVLVGNDRQADGSHLAYCIVTKDKLTAMNKAVSNAAELSKAAMETAVVTPVVTPTEVAKGDGAVGTSSTKHADEVRAKRSKKPKKNMKKKKEAGVRSKLYINITYTVHGKMTKHNKNVVVTTAPGGDSDMNITDFKVGFCYDIDVAPENPT